MPLENATNISQLDDRYPLPSDPGSRGDDHLRLVKGVLKKQFPGVDGNGFKKPITLTEDFLNSLPQTIQDLQNNMDKRWPIGCLLLLVTTANPNGDYPGTWERVDADATLYINQGNAAPGALTGNNNPTVPVPRHTHGASFSGNQLPGHSHGDVPARVRVKVGGSTNTLYSPYQDGNTNSVSAGTPTGSVTVSESGTVNATIDVRGQRLLVNVWKRTS
ncbi:hypothetical protein ACJ8S7_005071 [Klebsiella pneumoniae]|nr:hypothetical protein [Klebsiella pneumoniae]